MYSLHDDWCQKYLTHFYSHFVAKMIKPRISNLGVNDFFVASKSLVVLTTFCMSICKDVLLTERCNLHGQYSCIDSNECLMLSWTFHFFETRGSIISATILCCNAVLPFCVNMILWRRIIIVHHLLINIFQLLLTSDLWLKSDHLYKDNLGSVMPCI